MFRVGSRRYKPAKTVLSIKICSSVQEEIQTFQVSEGERLDVTNEPKKDLISLSPPENR